MEKPDIPKEELQKINSIIGKATYNDYHWWNLIGLIKNLMESYGRSEVQSLKSNIEKHLQYQIHNTEEETSNILEAVNEDILEIINNQLDGS